ncbi:proteoglycan 4-like, partial [Drosophila subpulchrella]|uniref:proteoglycan 4-like n=1 Tax=Drosophila subpulchrella TaxID=1486046 RepID=UPI0018A15D6D
MAVKATRPRSGLQPGVVQRHERRHAGSKNHVASHEAVKRISRPEQRPQRQQRPVAPTAAPTAPDTWSPTTQRASPGARNERPAPCSATHVIHRSVHCVFTSACRQHPPRHQQRPLTCSPAAPIKHSPSATSSANRASSVPTAANSSALSGIRAQRTAPRAATTERHQAGQQPCPPSAHHTDQRCRASGAPRDAPTTCSPGAPNDQRRRNHIGQPLPHVNSTCRAPAASRPWNPSGDTAGTCITTENRYGLQPQADAATAKEKNPFRRPSTSAMLATTTVANEEDAGPAAGQDPGVGGNAPQGFVDPPPPAIPEASPGSPPERPPRASPRTPRRTSPPGAPHEPRKGCCDRTSARAVPQTPGRTIAPSEMGWEPDLQLFLSGEEEDEVLQALRECPDAGQVMEEAQWIVAPVGWR